MPPHPARILSARLFWIYLQRRIKGAIVGGSIGPSGGGPVIMKVEDVGRTAHSVIRRDLGRSLRRVNTGRGAAIYGMLSVHEVEWCAG